MAAETHDEQTNDHDEQTGMSPWESKAREGDDSTSHVFEGVDWRRRELGDEYPANANYHCNACMDFHTDQVSELKHHIEEDHDDTTWWEYLVETGLHRCAGCRTPLKSVRQLYCTDCEQDPKDKIPCRNCGETMVLVSDPFCSASCASERLPLGPPFDPPADPENDWLDHPHRLEDGIPYAAPFVANHDITCRECYLYGDEQDDLHDLAVHVAEAHNHGFGWSGYIRKYTLRQCRVCDAPLESLLPLYCSHECQHADPDPVVVCQRDGCETGVDRKQKYCSRDCYLQDKP